MAPSIQSLASRLHRSVFVRDAVASTVGIAGLYGLFEMVPVRPLVIPGYLLIVGFDLLEAVVGSAGSFYQLFFALYILGLGLIGGLAAHGIRRAADATDLPPWRLGLAAGFAVVAVIAFLFAAMVYTGTAQSEPVRIASATGIVLLVLAALVGLGPRLATQLKSA